MEKVKIGDLKVGDLVVSNVLDGQIRVKNAVWEVEQKGNPYSLFCVKGFPTIKVYGGCEWEVEKLTPKEAKAAEKAIDVKALYPGLVYTNLWTSGCDPEVFVKGGDGKVLPAFRFLPEKKKALKPINTAVTGVFWDGFQAEFTVLPRTCHAYLVDSIQQGLKAILTEAKKVDEKAKLDPSDVVDVGLETLLGCEEEHVALGCSPSVNCYAPHPVDVDGRRLFWRTAGFHVHQTRFEDGETKNLQVPDEEVIKFVDATAGVVMTSMLAGLEDSRRRTLYGRAGEYRLPKYGFEYRTLGSAVLWHPAVTHFALDLTRAMFVMGQKGLMKLWEYDPEKIQDMVNEYDIRRCRNVVRKNRELLEAWIAKRYGFGEENVQKAMGLVLNGIGNYIELNVEKNWKMDGYWEYHSGGVNCDFQKFCRGLK